jgi:hypothetical protein
MDKSGKSRLEIISLFLAEAIVNLLFFPPHKWDGNEF